MIDRSTEPVFPGSGSVPRGLRLRLVSVHGKSVDAVLHVPPGGCGLAEGLELGAQGMSDEQRLDADRCRVVPNDTGWMLINDSQGLVCKVDGRLVLAAEPAVIGPGDSFELLLRHFRVEPLDGDGVSVPAEAVNSHHVVRGAEDPAGFDLRNLASMETLASESGAAVGEAAINPFDVLDIAGAKPKPSLDSLARLFGDDRAAAGKGAKAAHVPPVSSAIPTSRAASDSIESGSAQDVFEGLHQEFDRVVRDPTELAGRTDWGSFLAPEAERAPSLAELSRRAKPYPLLRDILLPRDKIDKVLDDFEPLAPTAVFEIGDDLDVLRLFVPELSHLAGKQMPSLTRREHHAMSPDSHLSLGNAHREQESNSDSIDISSAPDSDLNK